MLLVELLEVIRALVVAENALVDGLEQESCRHDIERRVILDVLQRDLDDRLIQLLGGDAVEERELQLRGDLGDPGDVLVEAGAGVLDREIDLVRVVRLTLAVALDDGNCHENSLQMRRCSGPVAVGQRVDSPGKHLADRTVKTTSRVAKCPKLLPELTPPAGRLHHYISGVRH